MMFHRKIHEATLFCLKRLKKLPITRMGRQAVEQDSTAMRKCLRSSSSLSTNGGQLMTEKLALAMSAAPMA